MAKVFVFLEAHGQELKKGSLELLTAAKNSGREVIGAVIGAGAKGLVDKAAAAGAGKVYLCDASDLGVYNPARFASVAQAMIKESGADLVLASSSATARALFPRVAAQLDAGVPRPARALRRSPPGDARCPRAANSTQPAVRPDPPP